MRQPWRTSRQWHPANERIDVSTAIAISGKGGSGKTTLAAMVVRHLVERVKRSVLAVDADPNSCLGLALGVEMQTTVAEIREAALARKLDGTTSAGGDRERAVEYAIQRAVTEAAGFDLLAMGLPEGPKCYCAVNHLLRKYLDQAADDYRFIVTDNEAGMEHLSRRTTDAVDLLLVVAEPSPVGMMTARRILGLSERLPIHVHKRGVLWNKVTDPGRLPDGAEGLPTVGRVPYDKDVFDAAVHSVPVFRLPADNPAYAAVGQVLDAQLGLSTNVQG
jgi:CO dehydrogenase maturation factor